MKKRRNQPDRMPGVHRAAIRSVAGICPSCALSRTFGGEQSTSLKDVLGVIYRRSDTSITFRCQHCELQWTVTLANLHKAAQSKIESISDETLKCFYDYVIAGTQFAAEREAERKNAIKKQTHRRVIRLQDRAM
jgi:hypothetical protein